MKLNLTFLFLFVSLITWSQEHDHDHDHEHPHTHDHEHHAHKYELGMANSPTYFVNEETWSYGMHLHFIRTIGDSKFGIGLGYERIFDEHKHNTIGAAFSYRPIHPLSLIVSPGITFEEGGEEKSFALHLESSYEFVIGFLHIGPLLEWAIDKEDQHISIGIHTGIGF